MTFKTYIEDDKGQPVEGALVTANDEITGESFQRSTDGGGFADVAMLGTSAPGHRVTFSVLDPQMRFKGYVAGDSLVIGAGDQQIAVALVPFV